jgi:hypothetical protein
MLGEQGGLQAFWSAGGQLVSKTPGPDLGVFLGKHTLIPNRVSLLTEKSS